MRSVRPLIVAALVGLYPARWKREYADEFRDVLMQRRLSLAAVLDTILSAAGQQVRLGEPWLIIGFPWMLLVIGGIVWNMLHPGPYARDSVGPSIDFLPPLVIGYWTVWRNPEQGHGGRAAMKHAMLISWPLCALGILYGLGILRILVLGPGDPSTTFHEHGFAYTLYDHQRRSIDWFPLFANPILQVPFLGLIGWLGGLAARGRARRRQAT